MCIRDSFGDGPECCNLWACFYHKSADSSIYLTYQLRLGPLYSDKNSNLILGQKISLESVRFSFTEQTNDRCQDMCLVKQHNMLNLETMLVLIMENTNVYERDLRFSLSRHSTSGTLRTDLLRYQDYRRKPSWQKTRRNNQALGEGLIIPPVNTRCV